MAENKEQIEKNRALVKEMQGRLFKGTPEEVGQLFHADLEWEIAGDTTAFPWIGKKKGRSAIVEFVRDTREQLDRGGFDVDDTLINEQRAVMVGHLVSKVKRTGKIIKTPFAIVLTFAGDVISRFQMMEDSWATSLAAD